MRCLQRVSAIFVLSTLGLACASTISSNSAKLNGKPKEVLLQALRAKSSAKSYRFKSSQTGTTGQNFSVEAEYVAPDKYHILAESNLAEKGKSLVEMIVIGEESFSRTPGKPWEKERLTPEEAKRERMKEEMLIKNLTSADESAITLVGTENLEGMKCHIYQYSSGGTTDMPSQGRTKTWVGATDGFPRKVEIEIEMMVQGKPFGVTQTTTYRDYNTDINIVAPMQ